MTGWTGEPAACTCPHPAIVATLEETLSCPAGWEYLPGTGWLHSAAVRAPLREFLAGLIADAAWYRARDDSATCADCWNGQCPDHAGDHARELAYIRLLGAVEDADSDKAAIKAFEAALAGAA